ncbi:uncharacterized protein LOC110239820, partial [Paramuricea clavata]
MNEQQETLRVQLRGSLVDLLRQLQNLDSEQLDAITFRIGQLAFHIIRLCDVNLVDDEIQHCVTQAMYYLQRVEELNTDRPFTIEVVNFGRAGRPGLDISLEQLNYFLNYQFSISDIARTLGVSQSTIFRRMRKYGLFGRSNLPPLSDDELDAKMREVLQEFPNAGYRRVISQLAVAGLNPPQMSVRESMRRVDPQGVAVRWLRLTPRRQYSVSGPLALWHIDGNHKLT